MRPIITVDQIARICHEANRAYCQEIGDDSQVPWESAPEWQRESAIQGVLARVAQPNMPPSWSHECWSAQKVNDGWRYGPVKDADAKTHPCLVPFEHLPRHQQAKDFLFVSVVLAVMEIMDDEVRQQLRTGGGGGGIEAAVQE